MPLLPFALKHIPSPIFFCEAFSTTRMSESFSFPLHLLKTVATVAELSGMALSLLTLGGMTGVISSRFTAARFLPPLQRQCQTQVRSFLQYHEPPLHTTPLRLSNV